MRITELKYLESKNLGNYEKAELAATAIVEENEDINAAILTLKTFVQNSLKGEISKLEVKETPAPKVETPTKEEKPKKTTKTKETKSKDTLESGQEIPPVIETVKEEKKAKSNNTVYDSSVPALKEIFGGYLAKKYGETWKTVKPREEIIKFTSSLNTKDFLDEKGNILDSFLSEVHGFFGK